MESSALVVGGTDYQDVAAAPDPSLPPLDAINRLMVQVRDCMVLRVWEASTFKRFEVLVHAENLGRVALAAETSGLVSKDMSVKMVQILNVLNPEMNRSEIVTFIRDLMMERVAHLQVDMVPVTRSILANNIHDTACLMFEYLLVLRLYNVMFLNSSMNDGGRKRRLVRPKFLANDGSVMRVFDDYKKTDPNVLLKQALEKREQIARQIAWARRRIALVRKTGRVLAPEKVSADFPGEAFQRLLASWNSRRVDVPRIEGQADPLDLPGAV